MNRPKGLWAVGERRARRFVLQAARLARWWMAPARWPAPRRYQAARDGRLDVLVHEARLGLGPRDGFGDPALEAGKRMNLRRAVGAFDGLVVTPEHPLSFWRALGRVTKGRGYTWGRELRGGCVVPAIGGGICLLSNALFEAAVWSGWQIHERHGHSLEAIAPPAGAVPLDATVAWPDVDLVIAPSRGLARLAVGIEGDDLRVAIFAGQAGDERVELSPEEDVVTRAGDRLRSIRVWRRRLSRSSGNVLSSDEVARTERRILESDEIGKTCLSCGEVGCRDRPAEETLVALRSFSKATSKTSKTSKKA